MTERIAAATMNLMTVDELDEQLQRTLLRAVDAVRASPAGPLFARVAAAFERQAAAQERIAAALERMERAAAVDLET